MRGPVESYVEKLAEGVGGAIGTVGVTLFGYFRCRWYGDKIPMFSVLQNDQISRDWAFRIWNCSGRLLLCIFRCVDGVLFLRFCGVEKPPMTPRWNLNLLFINLIFIKSSQSPYFELCNLGIPITSDMIFKISKHLVPITADETCIFVRGRTSCKPVMHKVKS